jgi:hypothetical protein
MLGCLIVGVAYKYKERWVSKLLLLPFLHMVNIDVEVIWKSQFYKSPRLCMSTITCFN